jgi:hypothetical protein
MRAKRGEREGDERRDQGRERARVPRARARARAKVAVETFAREKNPPDPSPATVPATTVPFLSSTDTVSFESFIRNLQGRAGEGRA